MSFDAFHQRFTAFGLAFALGLFAAAFFYGAGFSNVIEKEFEPAARTAASKANRIRNSFGGNGIGSSNHRSNGDADKLPKMPVGPTEGVKILSKPGASYTDEARINLVQGKVALRVTFSANGTIGAISVINGLSDGLTEAAIDAAKGIKFKPAKRGGVPYSVTKPVEYTFTIY